MDIVYLLVPLSAILVLAIMIVLWWAIYSDQFENLEAMGSFILEDDAPAMSPMPDHYSTRSISRPVTQPSVTPPQATRQELDPDQYER